MNKYYENLFKYKDKIEILRQVDEFLDVLSERASMKKDINGNNIEVSKFDIYNKLTVFLFHRDGYDLTKELMNENGFKDVNKFQKVFKQTSNPIYNKALEAYLAKKIKVNESEFDALYKVEPTKMILIEKILGSKSSMKNDPEILVAIASLNIEEDVMLQIHEQIDGFESIELISKDGMKYSTKNNDVLCIKKFNKDGTVDLASVDSHFVKGKWVEKTFEAIPIDVVLSAYLKSEVNKDEITIDFINVNELRRGEPIQKLMLLENLQDISEKNVDQSVRDMEF